MMYSFQTLLNTLKSISSMRAADQMISVRSIIIANKHQGLMTFISQNDIAHHFGSIHQLEYSKLERT